MAFNISTFRSTGPVAGLARPTLFEVIITLPDALDNGAATKVQLLCRAASIPPSIMEAIDVYYFGRTIKVKGDRTFPDWTVTVYNDEDFIIRNTLEQWSNKMNTHISNRLDSGYASETPGSGSYKAIAEVYQYGKTGPSGEAGLIKAYKFDGIFPKVVSDIPLDWGAVNQGEEFQVTFAYDWWIPTEFGSTSSATSIGSDTWGLTPSNP